MDWDTKLSVEEVVGLMSVGAPEDRIVWMRTSDYQTQLYLSKEFDSIFGRRNETLFEHPDIFPEFVLKSDLDETMNLMSLRHEIGFRNPVLFRITRPDGSIEHIRDQCVTIVDHHDKPLVMVGIGEKLQADAWHHLKLIEDEKLQRVIANTEKKQTAQTEDFRKMSSIVDGMITDQKTNTSNKIIPDVHEKKSLKFSRREKDCVHYLLLGKTAKETARLLNISHRTVEFHLASIKNKIQAKTKHEVFIKLTALGFDMREFLVEG